MKDNTELANRFNTLQSDYIKLKADYLEEKRKNNQLRKTFLKIEQLLLDIRMGLLESSDDSLDTPKEDLSIVRSGYMRIENGQNEQPDTYVLSTNTTENFDISSLTSPMEPEMLPEDDDEEPLVTLAKPPVKRGRPKGSKNKKKTSTRLRNKVTKPTPVTPKKEVGGTVFKEFEDLDVNNIDKNSKELSAYFAQKEDIELVKESEKHPNKFSAFGAALGMQES